MMKKHSFISFVLALIVGVAITLLILWTLAWCLTALWNNFVAGAFDNIPTVTQMQMNVIVFTIYLIRELYNWW